MNGSGLFSAGPQMNHVECATICPCLVSICPCCCRKGSLLGGGAVTASEACECDCFDSCSTRYAGCQLPLTCCHCTCLKCPPCATDWCCCEEEIMYMDGDFIPIKVKDGVRIQQMDREMSGKV
jgi:hypothetical protein